MHVDNASVINGSGSANRPGGKASGGGGFKPTDRAARLAMVSATNETACDLTDKLTASTADRVRITADLAPIVRSGIDYSTGKAVSAELAHDARIVGSTADYVADLAVLGQFERAASSANGKDSRRSAYRKAVADESRNHNGKTQATRNDSATKQAKGAAVAESLCLFPEHADGCAVVVKHLACWARMDSDTGVFSVGVPERNADFSIVKHPSGKGLLYRSLTADDIANIHRAIRSARGRKGVNDAVFADALRSMGYLKPIEEKPETVLDDASIDAALLGDDAAPVSLDAILGMFDRLLNTSQVTAGEALSFIQQATASFRREFASTIPTDAPSVADDAVSAIIGDTADDAETVDDSAALAE